jgi:saccharopine dehydrogenase-like NADP-dependent oxidoreductase
VLGAGFDPGVVNAYAALAREAHFDRIDSIDIVDVNAGNHGRYFATNFDPETNLREFVTQVWSWQDRAWRSDGMFEVRKDLDLSVVGRRTTYLTGHDEVPSLSQTLGVPTVRFWMGFNDHHIAIFNVLKTLGLLSEQQVRTDDGQEVVPLKVVKAVLPDPSSLAPDSTGKTYIGDLVKGMKNGRAREIFIYNIADHAEAYCEVGSQAISYTAGVPPVAAAMLIARGSWDVGRMAHGEELPPRPSSSFGTGWACPAGSRTRTGIACSRFAKRSWTPAGGGVRAPRPCPWCRWKTDIGAADEGERAWHVVSLPAAWRYRPDRGIRSL